MTESSKPPEPPFEVWHVAWAFDRAQCSVTMKTPWGPVVVVATPAFLRSDDAERIAAEKGYYTWCGLTKEEGEPAPVRPSRLYAQRVPARPRLAAFVAALRFTSHAWRGGK